MAKQKKGFRDYTALGKISSDLIIRNISFIFFLSFLAVIYIANAHYSEKTVREIQGLQEELKELRWKHESLRAEVMYSSKKSDVVDRVEPLGLTDKGSRPRKIVVRE